jgi:SAM-dependent methyltransferase
MSVNAEETELPDTGRTDGRTGHIRPRKPEDFDAAYTRTPAWEIGHPQRAFLTLAQAGAISGRVLDVGCGTGEHVLMSAALGLEVTGIDVVAAAISVAQRKARDRGLDARFLVGDALQLGALGEQFDTVLDCGLFHVFGDADRPVFVAGLRAVLPAGGRYFMLCFSDLQPGHLGPRRIAREEIEASFGDGWWIDSIEPAKLETTMRPEGAEAWLATITRT